MQALRRICALVAVVCWAACAGAAEVRLFAAASLSDALREIGPAFEARTGHSVRLVLGGSGLLQRQIEAGAPADVFFSADAVRVDELERGGLVEPGSRRVLLANELALIMPARARVPVPDVDRLADRTVRRVALGDPATVPAGAYAKAYLEKLGLWTAVAPKVVPLDNVRAVLAAVASGNVDAGIVFRTDAPREPEVWLVKVVPRAEGPRIEYPAVILRATTVPDAARALLDYLAAAEAQAVFERYGFLRPEAEVP